MTLAFTQLRFVKFLSRPWVRSSLVAAICILAFVGEVRKGGWLGVAAWVMLAAGVLSGLVAVGLFAVRNENTPRPTGRV